MAPVMTVEEILNLFKTQFPQLSQHENNDLKLEEVFDMGARMRLMVSDRHLRPGNTVSGPAMMYLADVAIYSAILGQIGPQALTVTTNFNINFMRKPEFGDLLAEARVMKLGKTLVVCECDIISTKTKKRVAHATSTYSIPPQQ